MGVLALVVEGYEAPVGIGQVLGVLEVGMGVAAQDDVDAARGLNDGGVLVVAVAIAKMGQADDELAVLLVAQEVSHLLGYDGGMGVADARTIDCRDEALQLGGQAEDAHAHAGALLDGVGTDEALAGGTGEVVVGADDGEAGHAEEAGHVVQSAVELVVADGAGIVAHEVHKLHLDLALEEAVVDGALREVAAVEQEHVGVLGAELLDEADATDVAPLVGLLGLDVVLGDGLDAGMGVAGVDEGERLGDGGIED